MAPPPPDAAPHCEDRDDGGYGRGCALGPDCDDEDPLRHHGARELCDGVDQNCDQVADEDADETCYSGPPETLGVGLCQPGRRSCAGGPCEGEVLPVAGRG